MSRKAPRRTIPKCTIPRAVVHARPQSPANLIRVNEAARIAGKMALPKAKLVRAMLNQVMDFAGEVLPGSCALPPYSETAFLAELGERLRSSRTRCDLSRRKLARRSGISERYIAQIEAGKANVSIVLLLRLASAIHGSQPPVA